MSRHATKPAVAVPTWTGNLTRTAAGISGRLQDASGWTLALSAIPVATGFPAVLIVPAVLDVRGDVVEVGTDEGPDRATLAELPFLHGRLEHHDGDWRGELAVRGLVVTLAGITASPGRIELTGAG